MVPWLLGRSLCDPTETFEEIEGYDEMITLQGIRFESHCEHHMAPIVGRAWVGYIPNGRVVGISKLARVVDVFAKRLQIQEKMTAQIANVIEEVLDPQGVAVVIKAEHHCMTTRGVMKPGTQLMTSRMLGVFRDNSITRQEFWRWSTSRKHHVCLVALGRRGDVTLVWRKLCDGSRRAP